MPVVNPDCSSNLHHMAQPPGQADVTFTFTSEPYQDKSSMDTMPLAWHHTGDVRQLIDTLDRSFTIEAAPRLAPLVHWGEAAKLPFHRWFRYREAFSPHLLLEVGAGQRILDPFCGSGTILVGAAQYGHQAVGVDVNPVAAFMARVKLTPLSPTQLRKAAAFLDRIPLFAAVYQPWPIPALSIAEKVFEPDILDMILRLRTAIEEETPGDKQVRDFLFLAWLAILEGVGSYFKEGNGIKYRNKQRRSGGYIARPEGVWQIARFGSDQKAFVRQLFVTQLTEMLADTRYWTTGKWHQQRIIEGDVRDLDDLLGAESFDSIVFSPPYANRFDYTEAFKVELWFGNFVTSYADMASLRKRSLRSHLGADLNRPTITIPILETFLTFMDQTASSWQMGIASALRGYFDDMYHVLAQCRRRAPNGSCIIVVGNSAFAGVIIPTDSLIAMLGQAAGFNSARILVARHLTVAPQQRTLLQGMEGYMRESVVILE